MEAPKLTDMISFLRIWVYPDDQMECLYEPKEVIIDKYYVCYLIRLSGDLFEVGVEDKLLQRLQGRLYGQQTTIKQIIAVIPKLAVADE